MGKNKMDPVQEQAGPARRIIDVNNSLSLRLAQLQVFGLGLAHLAHDVQNYLAIISESAGLMGDLLKLKGKQKFGWVYRFLKRDHGQFLDIDPFLVGLNTIQEEVVQGSSLTQRLSSFAHRLEEAESVFDGNKALEEIRDILLVQAGEKGIRLEIRLAKEAVMIETNSPCFQLAVFGSVEQVMEGLESGDWLVLEADNSDGSFQVHITSPSHEESSGLLSEEPNGQDFYRDIVGDLGGQIWKQTDDGKHVITLAFSLAGGT